MSELETTEYFLSANDVLEQDDRVETDVIVSGWNKKLRIRALSFDEMTKINEQSYKTEDGKTTDTMNQAEFSYWTIVYGVIRPRFNITQARKLKDNNGEIIKNLTDEIWNLGRIPKQIFDDYIAEQKRATKLSNGDFSNEEVPE